MPRERNLYDIVDAKVMLQKALLGSFLGVLAITFISYLVFCLEDASILSRTGIFTPYSHGNPINEVLGYWAVSFTPITSLETIVPDWTDDFYIYLAPAMVAGLAIALKTKSIKWSLVGGVFFIMWGILLPLVFMFILPIFGLVDPTSINASLVSGYGDVYGSFNGFYTGIITMFQSVFLGWVIAGTLETAAVVTVVSLPFALIFGVLQKLFSR
jgi:hypothetical protein